MVGWGAMRWSLGSGRTSVDTRRKQGRRVFLAAMVVSVAIHAMALSRSINRPGTPNGRVATVPASSDFHSAVRIYRLLVAEPDVRPELREAAPDDIALESSEHEPDHPPSTPDPEPEDPSSTLVPERSHPAATGAAAALRTGLGNPLLWGNIRDIAPRPGSRSIVLPERLVDHRVSGSTPADPWAFDTWKSSGRRSGRLSGNALGPCVSGVRGASIQSPRPPSGGYSRATGDATGPRQRQMRMLRPMAARKSIAVSILTSAVYILGDQQSESAAALLPFTTRSSVHFCCYDDAEPVATPWLIDEWQLDIATGDGKRHLRSRSVLRRKPVRHLADPSLAVAAVRATPARLLRDLDFLGLL